MGAGLASRIVAARSGPAMVPVAPPPTTRGNSTGPAAPLLLEDAAGICSSPSGTPQSCKCASGSQSCTSRPRITSRQNPSLRTKYRFQALFGGLKASGRKRTHPLSSACPRTLVPEAESRSRPSHGAEGIPRSVEGFSWSRRWRTLGSESLGRFLIRRRLGGSGSPWRLRGCCAK